MLQFTDIAFSYPDASKKLISHFSLDIEDGQVVALLGQNGTGKSTLLKIASGELIPQEGIIQIAHKPLSQYTIAQKAQNWITLSQRVDQSLFMDLSIQENLELWKARFRLCGTIEELWVKLSLPEKMNPMLFQSIRTLSGGEQQLFLSALVFLATPKMLFLDEHTSQLDPHMSSMVMQNLMKNIKKHHVTTLMITHDLSDALQYADRIVILRHNQPYIEFQKNHTLSMDQLKDALL